MRGRSDGRIDNHSPVDSKSSALGPMTTCQRQVQCFSSFTKAKAPSLTAMIAGAAPPILVTRFLARSKRCRERR